MKVHDLRQMVCPFTTILVYFKTDYTTSHGSPSMCSTRTLNSHLPLKGKTHLNIYKLHSYL